MTDMVASRRQSQRRSAIRRTAMTAAAIVVAAVAVGCSPRVAVHGNHPDSELITEIIPGTHNRLDVQQLLGSPSSISLYGEEIWYYISDRTETLAFFEPDVTERQVVMVRFGGDGVVDTVETFGKERGRDIEIVDRTTPTLGNEITVIDQIIGNIGRFED